MNNTERHIIKDGIRIAGITLLSFGTFYMVLAQVLDFPEECTNVGIHDEQECKAYMEGFGIYAEVDDHDESQVDPYVEDHYDEPLVDDHYG